MTMTADDILTMAVEAAGRKCHDDHKNHRVEFYNGDPFHRPVCECGTPVTVFEVLVNDRFDPEWRVLDPGEFEANHYRYPPHTAPEARCTHTVEFRYCGKREWRALYGININAELCELWRD